MIDEGFLLIFFLKHGFKNSWEGIWKEGPSGIREHKVLSMEEVVFDACCFDKLDLSIAFYKN
ncbi:hypothetical protein P9443_15710 [Peribacillus frigoritolerans]|jgi:hypothetical protein|uniref:hypothetical protein n=1 Tax=Peribacillus frigoritolerans TaxID=450367 RepID=UPI0022823DC4|nr:hypothetical protein [Peribacillus frigoritolerans]MCY9006398.1 hypothetical protein [Peribacillus frigoritolerans]MED4634347.1 hypothetical protein [Peribacillus frigoritolerans]